MGTKHIPKQPTQTHPQPYTHHLQWSPLSRPSTPPSSTSPSPSTAPPLPPPRRQRTPTPASASASPPLDPPSLTRPTRPHPRQRRRTQSRTCKEASFTSCCCCCCCCCHTPNLYTLQA